MSKWCGLVSKSFFF